MRTYNQKNRRGLALMELVIVLGIVGVVVGAIWGAASSVRENEAIHDTVQVVNDIAGRVRATFTGFSGAAIPGNVSNQIARNLFPETVVNDSDDGTVNSWSGEFDIAFDGATVGTGFSVGLTLPATMPVVQRRDACLALLTRIQGTATNYTTVTGRFPSSGTPLAYEPAQGGGPSLSFVDNGGWVHTTNDDVATIIGLIDGAGGCDGVSFYYKM